MQEMATTKLFTAALEFGLKFGQRDVGACRDQPWEVGFTPREQRPAMAAKAGWRPPIRIRG
jgi:hypothetical protein